MTLIGIIPKIITLDIPFFINLIMNNLFFAFALYSLHVITGEYKGLWGYILTWILLFGIVDFIALMHLNYLPMLEFTLAQFAIVFLIKNTFLEKYELAIIAIGYISVAFILFAK